MSSGARLSHRCLSENNFVGGKNRLVQFNWNFFNEFFHASQAEDHLMEGKGK